MVTIWDRYYSGMSLEEIKDKNPFASEDWLNNGEDLTDERKKQIEKLFYEGDIVGSRRIKEFGRNYGKYVAFRAIVHGLAISDGMRGIVRIEKLNGNSVFPDEVIITPGQKYFEGSLKQVTVNAYERDFEARKKCIDHHGLCCKICGFNFGKIYGEAGKGYIHVHHLKPLSEICEKYEVDPLVDLIPVCPNCHVILHKRKPPYSLEEVKKMMGA
jgi:ribosomal protein L18E